VVLAATGATPPPRGPSVRRVPARRDSIEGLPIARVDIYPGDVYDSTGHGPLAPFHRAANRLHFRTRRSTVRRQLLFAPGQAWSERLARESGRNLRALNFLEPRRIVAIRDTDSVDVVVETRDYWTTRPEINIESSGGTRFGSVGFSEANLLGFGKSVSFLVRSDPAGNSRQLSWDDPTVANTHHQLDINITRGEGQKIDHYTAGLPFYALESPRAYQGSWDGARDVPRLYHGGIEAARMDRRVEDAIASFGWKVGDTDLIRRLEVAFESLDRRIGETRLAPAAPAAFAAPAEDLRLRRLGLSWSAWRPRYVELVDIDRMDRIEDFDLGARGALTFGYSPRLLGSGRDEGYLGCGLNAGVEALNGFGWMRLASGGRLVPEAREMLTTLEARWYTLPVPGHTLVLAARGVAGERMPHDFQVITGGLDGLRAYPVQALAGQRLWRLNAEERWLFSPPSWALVKLGSVVFLDTARAWGLGSQGTGWFRDAGVGLRIGLPMLGVAQVIRADVAWPLAPVGDGRPVLSLGSSQAF
jgi:hypothetical protein